MKLIYSSVVLRANSIQISMGISTLGKPIASKVNREDKRPQESIRMELQPQDSAGNSIFYHLWENPAETLAS